MYILYNEADNNLETSWIRVGFSTLSDTFNIILVFDSIVTGVGF